MPELAIKLRAEVEPILRRDEGDIISAELTVQHAMPMVSSGRGLVNTLEDAAAGKYAVLQRNFS